MHCNTTTAGHTTTKPDSHTFDIRSRASWQSSAQARRRKFGRVIAASHYVTWFLGRTFPDAIPLVFVLGYPKSGTTWACQLIADILNLPFPQDSLLPIGFPAVVHGHETWTARYRRGVYVMRDGRDALVSLYFHLCGMDPAAAPDAARFTQFIKSQLRRPTAAHANWSNHVRSFLEAGAEGIPLLRYEELLTDPVDTLGTAMLALTGRDFDRDRLQRTIEKYSFSQLSGRTPGQEDRTSYLRNGRSGDWRAHFTREAAELFAETCGDTLISAGYEVDYSWVESVAR